MILVILFLFSYFKFDNASLLRSHKKVTQDANSARPIRHLLKNRESLSQSASQFKKKSGWVFKEKSQFEGIPVYESIVASKGFRSSGDSKHQIIFAINQANLEELEDALWRVSDPSHEEYGKHWTREQISQLTNSKESYLKLATYLQNKGFEIVETTLYFDYVTVRGNIGLWEEVLSTQFHEYKHSAWSGQTIHRATEYSLPEEINSLVSSVLHVIDFPVPLAPHPIASPIETSSSGVSAQSGVLINGYVTPHLFDQTYNVLNNTGSRQTSQAIYSTIGQSMSPSDLAYFQTYFNLPKQAISQQIEFQSSISHVFDNACVANGGNDCIEANLDVQYMMAVAQNIPTTHYYDNSSDWSVWLASVANMANPPKVFSISYGSYEVALTYSQHVAFTTEAVKLGLMGVTLLAASGDDGVAGWLVRYYGKPYCGYYPMFPASHPYVVSVGGTMGPESGSPEVACQIPTSSITTGGGFSAVYSKPSWQSSQVSDYFAAASTAGLSPRNGYSTAGRGFPDISALANKYVIVVNKQLIGVAGTSCSSPAIAAIVSLANSVRVKAGLSELGWLHPLLYSSAASSFIRDITSGDNKCTASSSVCCRHGFNAMAGWDPVTGLGVLDVDKFLTSGLITTAAPTFAPTAAPSMQPSPNPSESTSHAPSEDPSITQTVSPSSDIPSPLPSVLPTSLPSLSQSPTEEPLPSAPTTNAPSEEPSQAPTTLNPTVPPSAEPSSIAPSMTPTLAPSTTKPTRSKAPTRPPTHLPTSRSPTRPPTRVPTSRSPTRAPTFAPTRNPSFAPTLTPPTFKPSTRKPTTRKHTESPSKKPARMFA